LVPINANRASSASAAHRREPSVSGTRRASARPAPWVSVGVAAFAALAVRATLRDVTPLLRDDWAMACGAATWIAASAISMRGHASADSAGAFVRDVLCDALRMVGAGIFLATQVQQTRHFFRYQAPLLGVTVSLLGASVWLTCRGVRRPHLQRSIDTMARQAQAMERRALALQGRERHEAYEGALRIRHSISVLQHMLAHQGGLAPASI
jgi:hypothetical protein